MFLLNFLKIAVRNMLRQRVYSIINILGLAIGIGCGLLIFRYINYEITYDKCHSKADRIYRVATEIQMVGKSKEAHARSPWSPGELIKEEWPEVEEISHLTYGAELLITSGDKTKKIDHYIMSDSNFFKLFDYPLEKGSPDNVLAEPQGIVLNRELANWFFGDENPIGKPLKLNNRWDVEVTGILADNSGHSHLSFDLVGRMLDQGAAVEGVHGWYSIYYGTYVLLREGADYTELNKRFPDLVERHAGEYIRQHGMDIGLSLQPIKDIHLRSKLSGEPQPVSSMNRIYLSSAIALFIILIACINFFNLSTARLTHRAREVGLRKVFGAQKSQIVFQFVLESAFISMLAFVLGLALGELALPLYNHFSGMNFSAVFWHDKFILSCLIALFISIVAITSIGPSLAFASFQPIDVLKGQIRRGKTGKLLRQTLVVIQFTISIWLIISTVVVFQQMRYLHDMDLGFKHDHVICHILNKDTNGESLERFKQRLQEHSSIESVSASTALPGGRGFMYRLILPEGFNEDEVQAMAFFCADFQFLETYGLELAEGRFFDPDIPSDSTNWIMNEAAVKWLGWEKPLGMGFDLPPRGVLHGEVVGVVKDFNYFSAHSVIDPMVILPKLYTYRFISVKYSGDRGEALAHFEKVWKEFSVDWPFEPFYISDVFDYFYKSDQMYGKLFAIFAILAIFIASLGLYGLAAYTAESRTKEIGVRKVLGASTRSIVKLLILEFLPLIGIASVIAWVIAYFMMRDWLMNFAYRIGLHLDVFIYASLAALALAVLTVSYHAIRAALSNPANALRYE